MLRCDVFADAASTMPSFTRDAIFRRGPIGRTPLRCAGGDGRIGRPISAFHASGLALLADAHAGFAIAHASFRIEAAPPFEASSIIDDHCISRDGRPFILTLLRRASPLNVRVDRRATSGAACRCRIGLIRRRELRREPAAPPISPTGALARCQRLPG